jgi:signal transduction histidine kinase
MDALLVGSIGIGATGAILAWRERPEPGAVPLTVLLIAQCWWSATLLFRVQTGALGAKVFWLNVSWIGVPFIPVAWLLFALEYSGNSQYVRLRYVAAMLVIPVITAVLAITNDYHDLLHVSMELVPANGRSQLVRTFGPWYRVIAGYTYLLGLLGAIPLLHFITSDVSTFRGQSLAILMGLVVPWATNILFLTGVLPTGSIDPTPIAFSISGAAYLGALTRFELFGKSPTPIRPARQSTFERMRNGIIVLDRYQHIVDLNGRAAQILDTDPENILGRPLEEALPQLDIGVSGSDNVGQTIYRPENTTRAYDINRTRVTDTHGRAVGELITLHDISDYLRQQQRLEVVNRVFRHNIRSNVQVILGSAEQLDGDGNPNPATTIKQKAIEINEFSDKIREVLTIFERGRKNQKEVRLEAVLHHTIEKIRSEYPNVAVDETIDTGDVSVNGLVEEVIWNVLENATQHNTTENPQIRVKATRDGDRVEVVVADNGPGIDEEELVLLREGTETPLHHGSGVGLAIIVWGTELVDGEITFEENDPSGTLVKMTFPVGPDSEGSI